MRTTVFLLATLLWSGTSWAQPAKVPEPSNLSHLKHQIKAYHDSGSWEQDQRAVTDQARHYLQERLGPELVKPAIVLDIDETALTAWKEEIDTDFGYVPEHWVQWEKRADAPAIAPVLELYRYARSHNIAVFFVSGRQESSRDWTEQNLRGAGYEEFERVYLKPDDYEQRSAVPLKSQARRDIASQGYHILLNMGDQQSDLDGGGSDRDFKLPNPIYILP